MAPELAEPWVDTQLKDPAFRAAFLGELKRMHQEAITTGDPGLARWCMRERARLDRRTP